MRRRNIQRGLFLSLLLTCFAMNTGWAQEAPRGGSSDQDLENSVGRLKELRENLEAERRKAEELGGKEKSLLIEIESLEKDLGLTRQILKKLGDRETAVAAELSLTQNTLEEAEGSLEHRKQEMARTLRHMYMHGRYHSLEILFSSRSFPDLLEKFRFLANVASRNRQLLHLIETERDRVDQACRTLERRTRDLEELKAEKEAEGRRISATVGSRTGILDGMRTEKSKHERTVAELERSARELEALIAWMEAERARRAAAGLGGLEPRKGSLSSPVEGGVVVPFGKHRHPKFGTVTFSNGVDYQAPLGASVRAVAPGRVEHVSWLTGYGQCVILSHGDGYYTLYAHLSEVLVSVGSDVGEGEDIARVGETGSLIGPSLHFEIRRGREALNPAEWMRSR